MMVTTADPVALFDLAVDIKECILEGMRRGMVELPERACVITGEIAWDDCECGQLVVAIESTDYTDEFPDIGISADIPGGLGNRCGGRMLAATLNISMLRCSPIGGDNPDPPPCDALEDAARISVVDASIIRNSVQCCLSEWSRRVAGVKRIEDFVINTQTFVGADGMCQGSETEIVLAILNACVDCGDS